MGLDISHECWNGSYGAFNRWRYKIAEVAGFGDMDKRIGFGGEVPWPDPATDSLILLLDHSDCDGELPWEKCGEIANRLESLLSALETAGNGGGHVGLYADKTRSFIDGLRRAHAASENVEFF